MAVESLTPDRAFPVIDAHHHLWDPVRNNHPWLGESRQIPFRYGDYASLQNKPFLLDDYKAVSRKWNIVGSVTMEGEWNPDDPLGEVVWLAGLLEHSGWPAKHVAQAWLDRPELEQLLDDFTNYPFVVSVRHKPRATATADGAAGGMSDSAFQKGYSLLAKYKLHFDLQTPWWHLNEIESLLKHNDQSLIVINHTGLPADRSLEGLAAWKKAMQGISAFSQVRVKISGLGLNGGGWDAAGNRQIILDTLELFGAERCMFASNYPVDSLCAGFDDIYDGFSEVAAELSPTEQQALFLTTASEVYGLDTGVSAS